MLDLLAYQALAKRRTIRILGIEGHFPMRLLA